ncbi:MAG: hypothetical protein HY655_12270 [Acidobacteria bacterium]|nr:hypothetical protein [Acidobacteriota bacterium]
MPLGQDILTLAPEAAQIIRRELGVTQQDIANLTADDSTAVQGPDAQQEVTVPTTQQGDDAALPKSQIREIWLGNHASLGPLQARLPPWNPANANIRLKHVARTLVPEFFNAITEDINGVRHVTHRGALNPVDAWPRGHLVDNLTHTYNGLAWPDDGTPGKGFFFQVCELATATLWHHADVAALSGGAIRCDATFTFIRDLIDRSQPKGIWVFDGDSGARGCSGTAWDWRLHLFPLPAGPDGFQFDTDRDPTYVGDRGANMSEHANEIRICGSISGRAARVDYLAWWACQLYHHAKQHGSIWYMFMAILCARNAVADIVWIAAVLLHECGHAAGYNDHCGHSCCQDRAELFFQHAAWAAYGLPADTGVAERFATERWSMTEHGSTDCGPRVFSVVTEHCALLRAQHATRQVVTVSSPCGGIAINEDYQFFTPACPWPQMQGTDSMC